MLWMEGLLRRIPEDGTLILHGHEPWRSCWHQVKGPASHVSTERFHISQQRAFAPRPLAWRIRFALLQTAYRVRQAACWATSSALFKSHLVNLAPRSIPRCEAMTRLALGHEHRGGTRGHDHDLRSWRSRFALLYDTHTILEYAPRTTFHPQHSSYESPPAPRQRSERKGSLSTLADMALVHASISSLDGMCERSWQLKPVIPSVSTCIGRPSIYRIHHMKYISR